MRSISINLSNIQVSKSFKYFNLTNRDQIFRLISFNQLLRSLNYLKTPMEVSVKLFPTVKELTVYLSGFANTPAEPLLAHF
jgi:hypothetical protein